MLTEEQNRQLTSVEPGDSHGRAFIAATGIQWLLSRR